MPAFRRRDLFAGTLSFPFALQAQPDRNHWYNRVRRLGQININESDAADLDVPRWISYWSSLKMDALITTAGGIMAFYPTAVPLHRRARPLGSRDLFGEYRDAARNAKIRVIARLDPTYAFDDMLQAHPDWFHCSANGNVQRHAENPELHRTCMFSPYYHQHMTAIIHELRDRYDPDGFYTNGWPGTGLGDVCYCEPCKQRFRAAAAMDLPTAEGRNNPAFRRWTEWRLERVLEVWNLWQKTAAEKRADVVYIGNLGGSIRAEVNLAGISKIARWMNADHQDRKGAIPMWDCAQQGRVCYSVMQGRTASNVTSAYNMSDAIWRHTSKSPFEMKMWLAQSAASGMVPWLTWLGGKPNDTRWQQPARDFFTWLEKNEQHFFNRRSLAQVALVWPQRTQAWHPTSRSTDAFQGFYYALLENRIPFDLVSDQNLSADRLKPYHTLLLPDTALLSDPDCRTIEAFHARGGALVATHQSSLYDESGNRRSNFGLARLFQAVASGKTETNLRNSYMRIESPHALFIGLEGTSYLPGTMQRVAINKTTQPVLTRIHGYPMYPPEMVYPREAPSGEPDVIVRSASPRIVYFPGDVDQTFWRTWNPDLGRLLANAVRYVSRDRLGLWVAGDGLLDIFPWQTEKGLALHLLNYTNPALMKGPARKAFPVGPQQVRMELPDGFEPKRVELLSTGTKAEFHREGKLLFFAVPLIVDYEVAAIT